MSEEGRVVAETGRVVAEHGRVVAEDGRVVAEDERVEANPERPAAEHLRRRSVRVVLASLAAVAAAFVYTVWLDTSNQNTTAELSRSVDDLTTANRKLAATIASIDETSAHIDCQADQQATFSRAIGALIRIRPEDRETPEAVAAYAAVVTAFDKPCPPLKP